jgi:hypothetical protein
MIDWDLVDIKPSKRKFTQTNERIGPWHIVARLDRFLMHSDILSQDFNISSKNIPFLISDCKRILLELEDPLDFGPLPFIFNPSLLQEKREMEAITKA